MIEVSIYRNKNVAVFGLGKTGISVIRALKLGGSQVLAFDDSKEKCEALLQEDRPDTIALSLHENLVDPANYRWNTIAALILSPGVPLTHPAPHPVVTEARKANCPIICDIELLYNTCMHAKYVGITGTNGKSTTTSLIGHIFKGAGCRTEVGGNLGIPVLDLNPLARDGVYVLEMSSYQLDLLDRTHFNTAILLNITPDHIDRHGSMEGYIAAKTTIFRHQNADDIAIIGVDSAPSKAIYEKLQAEKRIGKVIPISTNSRQAGGVSVIDGVLYNDIDGLNQSLPLGKLQNLAGKHNGENIAASFAAAFTHGIPAEKIIALVQNFPGLKHRLQHVTTIKDVHFVNDSKATNAEAAEKALLSFPSDIYWIAGGVAKEGGIENLAPLFPRIKHAFLIGKAEEAFAETLKGKVPYTLCHDLKNAFEAAARAAFAAEKKGAIVLLSPACASFDQWANFEQRGDAFCKLAQELQQKMQHAAA